MSVDASDIKIRRAEAGEEDTLAAIGRGDLFRGIHIRH